MHRLMIGNRKEIHKEFLYGIFQIAQIVDAAAVDIVAVRIPQMTVNKQTK